MRVLTVHGLINNRFRRWSRPCSSFLNLKPHLLLTHWFGLILWMPLWWSCLLQVKYLPLKSSVKYVLLRSYQLWKILVLSKYSLFCIINAAWYHMTAYFWAFFHRKNLYKDSNIRQRRSGWGDPSSILSLTFYWWIRYKLICTSRKHICITGPHTFCSLCFATSGPQLHIQSRYEYVRQLSWIFLGTFGNRLLIWMLQCWHLGIGKDTHRLH